MAIPQLPPEEGSEDRVDRPTSIVVVALRAIALLALAGVLILVALPVAIVAAGT